MLYLGLNQVNSLYNPTREQTPDPHLGGLGFVFYLCFDLASEFDFGLDFGQNIGFDFDLNMDLGFDLAFDFDLSFDLGFLM